MLCIWKPSQSRTNYGGNRGAQPDICWLTVAPRGCCDFSRQRGSMSLLSRVGALEESMRQSRGVTLACLTDLPVFASYFSLVPTPLTVFNQFTEFPVNSKQQDTYTSLIN